MKSDNTPIFREATSETKPIWLAFRKSLYHDVSDEFHQTEMDLILNAPLKSTFLLLEKKEELPIGMLELSLRNTVDGCLSSPVGYIEGIILNEKGQGKGYGRKMVDFSKKWAKSKGCTELACDAELDDLEAQNFHKKMGFKETYRIVEYKMDIK